MAQQWLRSSLLITAAFLAFGISLAIALLPKFPTPPPQMPWWLHRLAGELGDKYWWLLAIGGLVAIWKDRRFFWCLVAAMLFAQIVIVGFKWTVAEMRPDGRMFHSFPSGHTLASFTFATIMSLRWRWGWLWFPFALLVGVSRVLRHAHWWQDVLGGAALGYLIGLATWQWWHRLQSKMSAPEGTPSPSPHPPASEPLTPPLSQTADQGE
ncbi:MAG: hypothetical protein C4295_09765 [Candidatus Fervidibacterota bacterium]